MNKTVLKVGFALLLALVLFPPVTSYTAGRYVKSTGNEGHMFLLAIPASAVVESVHVDYRVDVGRSLFIGLGILAATAVGAVAFKK